MVFSIAPACLCPNDNSAPATAAFNGEPEEATSLAVCVLGGVAPVPYRALKAEEALIGAPITEAKAVEAAKASVSDAMPLSKNGYKVHIVETLVKRAILT